MSRISIITPSLKARATWRQLQARHYADCGIERFYAIDDSRTAYDAMKAILDQIVTPYVVFGGDDDFHVPARLHDLAAFLNANPAYAGAHGQGILVQVENGKVGWATNYDAGLKIERAFSLMRTEIFKAAIRAVPTPADGYWGSAYSHREIMNYQNQHFVREAERIGAFKRLDGLQLIHCHHEGRGELDSRPHLWKRLVETAGGGWLASWLPSRSCSRRNLERARAAHHYEFMRFKRMVEDFEKEQYDSVPRASVPVSRISDEA